MTPRSVLMTAFFATTLVTLTGCSPDGSTKAAQNKKATTTEGAQGGAKSEAKALISESYGAKTQGDNGAALGLIEKACEILKKAAGPASEEYGSCLDDRASVLLRTGLHAEAKTEYSRARAILEKATPRVDPRFIHGIDTRIELIDILDAAGIKCREPRSHPKESTTPYFPRIEQMQAAMGKLNSKVAPCGEGPAEAVTVRAAITGTGVVLRAKARGPYAGTEIGKCVEDSFKQAAAQADLPPFSACFRGFTYPFMIGDLGK